MTIYPNWNEYTRMIEMQGTTGETPKPFTLPANGEDSGQSLHIDDTSSGAFSFEKPSHIQSKPP